MTYQAVIPTIGRSALLIPLLALLLEDACEFIDLPDNEDRPTHGLHRLLDEAESSDDPLHLMRCERIAIAVETGRILARKTWRTIYGSWNDCMDASVNNHEYAWMPLAVLNDDIALARGSIAEACRHLNDARPLVGLNYNRRVAEGAIEDECAIVHGSYRQGGLGGHAFVCLPAQVPRVDEGFLWWYGDDDLVLRTLRKGDAVGLALGAPVDHPVPSASGNQMPWLAEAVTHDEAHFRSLWGSV